MGDRREVGTIFRRSCQRQPEQASDTRDQGRFSACVIAFCRDHRRPAGSRSPAPPRPFRCSDACCAAQGQRSKPPGPAATPPGRRAGPPGKCPPESSNLQDCTGLQSRAGAARGLQRGLFQIGSRRQGRATAGKEQRGAAGAAAKPPINTPRCVFSGEDGTGRPADRPPLQQGGQAQGAGGAADAADPSFAPRRADPWTMRNIGPTGVHPVFSSLSSAESWEESIPMIGLNRSHNSVVVCVQGRLC